MIKTEKVFFLYKIPVMVVDISKSFHGVGTVTSKLTEIDGINLTLQKQAFRVRLAKLRLKNRFRRPLQRIHKFHIVDSELPQK